MNSNYFKLNTSDRCAAQVTKDKDAAVRGQDFEKAGQLRDREMELKAKISAVVAGAKEASKAEAESVEGAGPVVNDQVRGRAAGCYNYSNATGRAGLGEDDANIGSGLAKAFEGMKRMYPTTMPVIEQDCEAWRKAIAFYSISVWRASPSDA